MNNFVIFLLPVAVALAGARLNSLVLGKTFCEQFGFGIRFALGLGTGILFFSQITFFFLFAGIDAAAVVAWAGLLWGAIEAVLCAFKCLPQLKGLRPMKSHLWLLLLLPMIYAWWIFGRLSTLEGTLEFDASANWVFKAKVFYLTHGQQMANWYHKPTLAYAHWQYPTLVPALYAMGYGASGGVNEFVNKVWPFWMAVALAVSILSLGRIWQRPHPLPIIVATLFSFLPATLQFIRYEGGTMPLVFYASLSGILIAIAIFRSDYVALAAGALALAGCAATKFEGMIYGAIWFCVLLPIMWRRGWLKRATLWKGAGLGIFCLIPYALYRLAHPVTHPANFWWKEAVAAPGEMLYRLPRMWFLNNCDRFFSADFSKWSADEHGNITWAGHWAGLGSLVNPDLSLLPWLLIFLFVFSIWKKTGASRMAIICVSVATFVVLTALAFVTTCFMSLQSLEGVHDFGSLMTDFSANVVGRYYYPFFMACFLGIMAIWITDRPLSPPINAEKSPAPAIEKPASRSKKQHK